MRNLRVMENKFRKMTEEELKMVNPVIMREFGARNRVTSGSCEIYGQKKKRYNISLEDKMAHTSRDMLKLIGKRVKAILGADEVYHFGIKIA